jgi:membrane protease YdiL (CAAX protease family)
MQFLLNSLAAIAAHTVQAVPSVTSGEEPALTRAGIVLFVLGLTCDVYLLYRFLLSSKSRHSEGGLLKVADPFWGIRELLVAAGAIVAAFSLSSLLYILLAALTTRDLVPLVVISSVLLELGFLAAAAQYFKNHGENLAETFGIRADSALDGIHWGIIFGFGSLPPVQLLIALSESIYHAFGIKASDQDIAELFASTNSRLFLLLLVVFAVLIAPVFEEFFFRGFAYPVLKRRFGPWRALVLVSAVFALSHAHLPSMVPLFVLALGLGLSYELTGSLLVPITMHALFNSIMVAQLIYERAHP